MSEHEHIQQDTGNDNPEGLPTYDYLEEQERSNPNSRFGRWRSWIEKRAAERYADVTAEELDKRRQKGWGTAVKTMNLYPVSDYLTCSKLDTGVTEQAPPPASSVMSPMSAQLVSHRVGDTRLSVYHFGSRFIPHSIAPIRSLVSLCDDRYLLLGGLDGLGMLDIFPERAQVNTDDSVISHPLEAAKRRELWTGESIYQMNLLESYQDPNGGLQGVVLALVGADDGETEREQFKSVRMYNLASLFSLVRYALSRPDFKPVVIPTPKGWSHQQTTRRLHRQHAHAIAKNLRSMIPDSPSTRPTSPPGSLASSTTKGSCVVPESPPKHQDSLESNDSWDVIDDLPLRWATDFVNLATPGSKLSTSQILFYELWKNDAHGSRGTCMLAIATKTSILLYETLKGERSFKFVKEFYTPLPAKSINFMHQASHAEARNGTIYPEGERLKKERPNSRQGADFSVQTSPRARRISTPGDQSYGSLLSMFIIFEKKAGLIRISDSSVSEIELWDDGGAPLSPTHTSSLPTHLSGSHLSGSSIRRSIQALTRDIRGHWIPLTKMNIPHPPLTNNTSTQLPTFKSLVFMSRGKQTHVLPSPLPMPLTSNPPLRIIRWQTAPRQVAARLSIGNGRDDKLQILAFGEMGVEVVEMGTDFLFRPPEITASPSKGKEKAKAVSIPSENITRAFWDSSDETGFLAQGGFWDQLDTTSGMPEPRQQPHNPDEVGTHIERGQGIYAWSRKGLEDYKVLWFGEEVSADVTW
ncbi:hypothetical protein CPB86DRAFT_773734 [Serendipita vermifera]|nr:hypothetical protein CPB86DRAFT_773734 [Serendipita vermifera]